MARGNITQFFKIRRTTDGLFSCGGMDPRFDNKGKAWTTLSGLKNHLNLAMSGRYGNKEVYKDCEVIHIELEQTVKEVTPLSQILKADELKKEEKKKRIQKQQTKDLRNAELAELERLQKKYPNRTI